MLLLASFGASAKTLVSETDPQIEILQPFSASNSNQPKHFSSGSDIEGWATIDWSLFDDNLDERVWMRKNAGDRTFTEHESRTIFNGVNVNDKTRWTHGQVSDPASNNADVYPANRVYLDDDNSEIILDDGESKTITVNGNEHTFSIETDGVTTCCSSSDIWDTDLTVDGTQYQNLYPGEYVQIPGENEVVRVHKIVEGASTDYLELGFYDTTKDPADGNYEYKLKGVKENGDEVHSRRIYFDVGSSDGNNIPYVEEVRVDGKEINYLEDATGIAPGSVLEVDVAELESDNFNASLYDAFDSTPVNYLEAKYLSNESQITSYTDQFLDQTLGIYFDVSGFQNPNTITVPFKLTPEQVDESGGFLGTVDGSYQVGFELEDLDTFGVRRTPDYGITTDLQPGQPVIEKIQGSKYCENYKNITEFKGGSLDCVKVVVSDSDSEDHYVELNLTQEYDGVKHVKNTEPYSNYDIKNGTNYIFNVTKEGANEFDENSSRVPLSYIDDSGNWSVSAYVSDGVLNDTKSYTWSVPWGNIEIDVVQPSNTPFSVLDNETFTNSYNISCVGGAECVNQNETLSFYWDPKSYSNNFLGGLS